MIEEYPILSGFVTLSKWAIVASLLTGSPGVVAGVAAIVLLFYAIVSLFVAMASS